MGAPLQPAAHVLTFHAVHTTKGRRWALGVGLGNEVKRTPTSGGDGGTMGASLSLVHANYCLYIPRRLLLTEDHNKLVQDIRGDHHHATLRMSMSTVLFGALTVH